MAKLEEVYVDGDSGGLAGMARHEEDRRAERSAKREIWQEWRPTADPETVLFIPGSYGEEKAEAYVNYCTYVPGAGRNRRGAVVHCRCKGGRVNTPCVLCHMAKADLQERQASFNKLAASGHGKDAKRPRSSFEPSAKYAFTILRLSWFHKVDVQGQNGRSWIEYERCPEQDEIVARDATDCPHCLNGVPRVFGLRRYFNLGWGYYEGLMDIERELGHKCKTCGGKIVTQKYICRHCYRDGRTTVLLDPRSTQMKPEDRATFWKKSIRCTVCDRAAKPLEVIKCSNDCGKPRRRKIWDAWVTLRKQGGERMASIVKDADFDPPDEYPEEIRKLMTPYDFERMFEISCDEQAEMLNVPNPFEHEIPASVRALGEPNTQEELGADEHVEY